MGVGPGRRRSGAGRNPLEWKSDLALWTAVVFLALLAVLWKFAWKPIAEGLDKREQNVAGQIAEAEAANQKAKDILADYQQNLAAAEEQVRGILDQGRRDAEQARPRVDRQGQGRSKEPNISGPCSRSTPPPPRPSKSWPIAAPTLAVELAGKIVRTKLNPADHARLIEQAVAGFVQGEADGSGVSRN